jgi:hypothetical protein
LPDGELPRRDDIVGHGRGCSEIEIRHGLTYRASPAEMSAYEYPSKRIFSADPIDGT